MNAIFSPDIPPRFGGKVANHALVSEVRTGIVARWRIAALIAGERMSRLMRPLLLMAVLIAPAIDAFAQQAIVITPQTLLSRDTLVRLNVTSTLPFAYGRESVTLVNNKFTVTMRSIDNAPLPGPTLPSDDVSATNMDVILGRLPQGSYTVEAIFLNRLTSVVSLIGTAQFTVAEDVAARQSGYPAHNFTDLWWNPGEPGWGISIHVKRQALFAAWYVYDAAGKPTWYTMTGGVWQTPKIYAGTIYTTRAAPNSGLGPLSGFEVAVAGSGTIEFLDYDRAILNFTVNGAATTAKNIIREVF